MADTQQQEYIMAEQKARAQEETVRKVHQKEANHAMDVCARGGGVGENRMGKREGKNGRKEERERRRRCYYLPCSELLLQDPLLLPHLLPLLQ